jgi:hypothetical protein
MRVPVILPVVHAHLDDRGSLTVDVDGRPYPLDQKRGRGDLRTVLDDITREQRTAVRVEVTESDDATYTDIVTPPDDATASAADGAVIACIGGPGPNGTGFRPGEQVALACVLLRQTADEQGAVVLHLPPALLARRRPSLMLLGLDSKVMTPLNATVGVPA